MKSPKNIVPIKSHPTAVQIILQRHTVNSKIPIHTNDIHIHVDLVWCVLWPFFFRKLVYRLDRINIFELAKKTGQSYRLGLERLRGFKCNEFHTCLENLLHFRQEFVALKSCNRWRYEPYACLWRFIRTSNSLGGWCCCVFVYIAFLPFFSNQMNSEPLLWAWWEGF